MRFEIIGLHFNGALIALDGLVEAIQVGQREAEVVGRIKMVWLKRENLTKVRGGLLRTIKLNQRQADVVVRINPIRTQAQGLLVTLHSRHMPIQTLCHKAKVEMQFWRVGRKSNRLEVVLNRRGVLL